MSSFHFLHSMGKLVSLEGTPISSEVVQQKVVLVVNVASRCGLTPQYTGLVSLQSKYEKQGFTVLGVPCNQFGRQEPGSSDQIRQFCDLNFGVNFPLLIKQDVNGANRSLLYQYLVGDGEDIQWNFEKFLLSRQGNVVHRFTPNIEPNHQIMIEAIENALQ